MLVSVLGDTFADVVCRPLEHLPDWGKVREVAEYKQFAVLIRAVFMLCREFLMENVVKCVELPPAVVVRALAHTWHT